MLGIPGTDGRPLLQLKVLPEYVSGFSLGMTPDGQAMMSTVNLRFKIINPLLVESCGIGSTQDPVRFNLIADMDTITWYDNALGATISDDTFAAPATLVSGLGVLVTGLGAALLTAGERFGLRRR